MQKKLLHLVLLFIIWHKQCFTSHHTSSTANSHALQQSYDLQQRLQALQQNAKNISHASNSQLEQLQKKVTDVENEISQLCLPICSHKDSDQDTFQRPTFMRSVLIGTSIGLILTGSGLTYWWFVQKNSNEKIIGHTYDNK